MKYDFIIGIDPDCEKSGVAFLSTYVKFMSIKTFSFPELIGYLKKENESAVDLNASLLVVVEAGWLISHNWHTNAKQSARVAAQIGNKTGRNHETGRKIIEMCKHYGIEVVEQRPLKKCWQGPDGKITHDEIKQFIPGFPSKSNQETRDAALLAWNYAGFPIKLKSIGIKPKLANVSTPKFKFSK